jgi:hypothetical protein
MHHHHVNVLAHIPSPLYATLMMYECERCLSQNWRADDGKYSRSVSLIGLALQAFAQGCSYFIKLSQRHRFITIGLIALILMILGAICAEAVRYQSCRLILFCFPVSVFFMFCFVHWLV